MELAVVPMARTTLPLEPAPSRRITSDLPDLEVLPAGRYLVRAVLDIGLDHYLRTQKRSRSAIGETLSLAAQASSPSP